MWRAEQLDVLEGVMVMGNRDYLQQLLFIFIENAFKYTLQGEVVLSVLMNDNHVGISIRDTGIGLDKDEVPLIFERFFRADPSRGVVGGTGLGLSIAKWILEEHGGSVEVYTRKDHGSTFIIWLPVLDEHAEVILEDDEGENRGPAVDKAENRGPSVDGAENEAQDDLKE